MTSGSLPFCGSEVVTPGAQEDGETRRVEEVRYRSFHDRDQVAVQPGRRVLRVADAEVPGIIGEPVFRPPRHVEAPVAAGVELVAAAAVAVHGLGQAGDREELADVAGKDVRIRGCHQYHDKR
jgi:hypothetical protein